MSDLPRVHRLLRTVPPPLVAFLWSMGARLWLLYLFPWNYSFDAYQRWGGKEHLLVQGWLPAAQAVLWLVDKAGGTIFWAFVALSVVASLAHAAGTRVAEWLGGREAAWAFVLLGSVGPFIAWSRVPYQEGTFLFFLFGALAAASYGRWLLADLLIGAVGLVRYEGWAFLPFYVAWRRTPAALLCGWGPAAWLFAYFGLGLRGYAASPVDFDDWEGLGERFNVLDWLYDVSVLGEQVMSTGVLPILGLGVWGAVILARSRRHDAALVLSFIAAQIGITLVWIAGLETSIHRMQAIPGMLFGLLAAVAVADLWRDVADTRVRRGLELLLFYQGASQIDEAAREARMSLSLVTAERSLIREIRQYPDVVWWVEPRAGLGTRERHDACEALQGLQTDFQHGERFWCEAWLSPEEIVTKRPTCTGWVRWERGEYEVWPVWPAPPGTEPIRVTSKGVERPGEEDEHGEADGEGGPVTLEQ